MMKPKPLWRSLASSDPGQVQMQLLGVVCKTLHPPVDQVLHQENRNKGILHLPRRQPEEQQLCLAFCAFSPSLGKPREMLAESGQGRANRNTDIKQQDSKYKSCQTHNSSQCQRPKWIMGREGEN